jgi:hypothetical protein
MAGKKYWDIMYTVLLSKCQILNCIIGNRTRAPPDRMWTLKH